MHQRWTVEEWLPLALCAFFALGAIVSDRSTAEARQRDKWRRTREQGVMLARIVANEASYTLRGASQDVIDREIRLIGSVVLNNRDRYPAAHWIDIMENLSPHVTKAREANQAQQEWSSTLIGCSKEQPTGWRPVRDGNWTLYAKPWVALCERAVEWWLSNEPPRPFLYSWGSTDDAQRNFCAKKRTAYCISVLGINKFFAFKSIGGCASGYWDCATQAWVEVSL